MPKIKLRDHLRICTKSHLENSFEKIRTSIYIHIYIHTRTPWPGKKL
jgi:hypothetical protein